MSDYQLIYNLICSAIAYLGDKESMVRASHYCSALLIFGVNYSASKKQCYEDIAFEIGLSSFLFVSD